MSNWTGRWAPQPHGRKGELTQLDLLQIEAERRRRRKAKEPLLDFVPHVTPWFERPEHLSPVCEAFERIKRGEVVNLCFSVPPQHGKSESILHGMVQLLLASPRDRLAYISYAADFAHDQSKIAQGIGARAGLRCEGSGHRWKTTAGGGFIATGIDGQITGRGVSKLLVVDDPFKTRAEAESPVTRNKVYDAFSGTLLPRIHPTASVIVLHTRWHEDDLIGRLSRLRKIDGSRSWEFINLSAIRSDGSPLWHQRPATFFAALREAGLSDYDWESQYLGRPRPRGAKVFRGLDPNNPVAYYDELPKTFRIGKGVDLAYTAKTRADKSVAVVLLQNEGDYYVADVRRAQVEVDRFIPTLVDQSRHFPGPYLFYTSSTEQGIAQLSRLLPDNSVRIHGRHADADKFTRAQSAATAWNRGKIMLPSPKAQQALKKRGLDVSWVPEFLRVVEHFTGVSDAEDDDVDALAAAFDQVGVTGGKGSGKATTTYESPLADW